ncbi:MAG: protein kinase [Bacteroidales bacterium]
MLISLVGKYDTYEYNSQNQMNSTPKKRKFSAIYRGKRKSDGAYVIIKHIKQYSAIRHNDHKVLIEQFLLGISALHSSVVQTYEIVQLQDEYFIVREYLQGVDAKTLICDPDYSHLQNSFFSCQVGVKMCEVLHELHMHSIIHCNIKPSNIFIECDDEGKIDVHDFSLKIVDFEMAHVHDAQLFYYKKLPFSLVYSPPEQVLHYADVIDNTSDLYCLGLVMYEIITRRPPFYSENHEMLVNFQINKELQKNSRISQDMLSFVQKATSKFKYSLPPNRYSYEQNEKFLEQGKQSRFQSAQDMKEAIEEMMVRFQEKKNKRKNTSWFSRLFKRT